MITTVFVLGLVNLCLGFVLAVLLERPIAFPLAWPAHWRRIRIPRAVKGVPQPKPASRPEPDDDLWGRLRAEGIDPATFAEAVLWTVKLDLVNHRQTMIDAQEQLRGGVDGAIASIVSQGEAWRKRVSDLADGLSNRKDEGDVEFTGEVEETLLDHVFQITTALEKIEELAGQQQAGDDVTSQICGLNAAMDTLRDVVDEILARSLRTQQRLSEITKSLQHPHSSPAFTRLGMETLFQDWWTRDAERVRLVSTALLDLDRFAQVNQQWGSQTGDQILAAFEGLLQSLLRKGRGFDRVVRVSGQSFLLFLGDTAYRNASSGAERIRQTIEAVSFRVAGENVELTASVGVVEVGKSEQLTELLARLRECVHQAKQAGRNRSFLDDGSGPQPIQSPQYEVESQVIDI